MGLDTSHRTLLRENRMIQLEERLGHVFNRPNGLRQALVHVSSTNNHIESNERLEFLGDRILGLVIAEMLFQQFAEEEEGDLAYRFTALTRRETLVRVARKIELGQYIELSNGERETGGADKDRVLANTCEAVIAALYLDGGYTAATNFIKHYWAPFLKEEPKPPKDPKTTLQEWAQAANKSLPVYSVTNRLGPDHAPWFTVEVEISGELSRRGHGANKRAAEQAAAGALLAYLEEKKQPI